MSTHIGDHRAVMVKGDYRPAKLYRGGNNVAGWHDQTITASGRIDGTYNDFIGGQIRGASELRADWRGVSGALSQIVTTQGTNMCPSPPTGKWALSNGAVINGDWIELPNNNSAAYVDVLWNQAANTISIRFTSYSSVTGGKYYITAQYLDANKNVINANGAAVAFTTGQEVQVSIGWFADVDPYKAALASCTYVRLLFMRDTVNAPVSYKVKNPFVAVSSTSYSAFVPNSPSPAYPSPVITPPVKNWVKYPYASSSPLTTNGITFTVNLADRSVRAVGTATNFAYFGCASAAAPIKLSVGSTYTVSGGHLVDKNLVLLPYIGGSVSWANAVYVYTSETFVAQYTDYQLYIQISVNAGTIDLTFYPQIELGSTATAYEFYKPRTAGSYKIACPTGGWWEFTLADDLMAVSTYLDKVELDVLIGKGKIRRQIVKKVFTGSEGWAVQSGYDYPIYLTVSPAMLAGAPFRCNYYKVLATYETRDRTMGYGRGAGTSVWLKDSVYGENHATFKTWLAAQNTAGNPVIVYYVAATESVTPITLTHVDTSTLPELTLSSLGISAQSYSYPYNAVDSVGSVTSGDGGSHSASVEFTLRGVQTVKDTLEQTALGIWNKTQRIKQLILDGVTPGLKMDSADIPKPSGGYDYAVIYPSDRSLVCAYFCTHLAQTTMNWPTVNTSISVWFLDSVTGCLSTDTIAQRVAKINAVLAAQYAAGTPVILYYQLATPIVTHPSLGPLPTYPKRTDMGLSYAGVAPVLALSAKVAD